MRALRIIIGFLVLGSAFACADHVYSVEMTGTFTATAPCTSDCTETLSSSFQMVLDPTLPSCIATGFIDGVRQPCYITVIPSTFSLTASGFLGSFVAPTTSLDDQNTIWTFDSMGDEIDIEFGSPNNPIPLPQFEIFDCKYDDVCWNHFAGPVHGSLMFAQEWSTTVKAPEPSSLALLPVPVLLFLFLRNRRQRIESVDRHTVGV